MSGGYRIYTYKDPYRLQDADFWQEIRFLPHFCASDVMAKSLWDRYTKEKDESISFENFFWPLDNLVRIAFPQWEGNIETQIRQHIELSKTIRRLEILDQRKHNNPPRTDLFSALMQNRGPLLDGLRMFTELNVDPDSLDMKQANTEQKVFIYLYEKICHGEETDGLTQAFKLDEQRLQKPAELFHTFIQSAIEEEGEYAEGEEGETNSARAFRIDKLNSIDAKVQKDGLKKIVVHGIHQFKPLQLRLLSVLEKAGTKIIFLFNYLPEYPHIYDTWARIYSWFDVPILEDQKQAESKPLAGKPEDSWILAKALAGVLDAEAPVDLETRKAWIRIAERINVTRFENTSEMANHVARMINENPEARNKNGRLDMRKIPQKIYSASADADDLLKLIFPEYAGDRHFLNYPIGQFFVHLYNMWDETKKELTIEVDNLRACALSGVIFPGREQRLSSIIDITEPMLNHVNNYTGVKKRLKEYLSAYQNKQQDNLGIPGLKKKLDLMTCYNPQSITEDDIRLLIRFVEELQKCAVDLFGSEETINFQAHFQHLGEFIQNRTEHLAKEEERKLVDDLLERFQDLKKGEELSGTMEDIRKGLFYYLSQRNRNHPDWLVRNFEQIEGDILRSQKKKDDTYHFACLSDSLICRKSDDILPWPLNDHFVHKAYTPIALVFQVYYSSLCDYQDYMQYALFYGLYYNRANVKLSYVAHIEPQREEQLFFPLQILGLKENKDDQNAKQPENGKETAQTYQFGPYEPKTSTMEKMDFFLCPYKYYLDSICSDGLSFDSEWLISKLYVSLLEDLTWKQMQGMTATEKTVRAVMKDQQEILREVYPFLRKANDEPDLLRQALNYFMGNLMDKGKVSSYHAGYQDIRQRFSKAKYFMNESDDKGLAYEELESLVTQEMPENAKQPEPQRVYSLSKLAFETKKKPAFAQGSIKDYLENEEGHLEHPGDWCHVCRFKPLCKIPYMKKS